MKKELTLFLINSLDYLLSQLAERNLRLVDNQSAKLHLVEDAIRPKQI
jgi:hypothetical protein